MFRWLLVCAALCAGAYYIVSRATPTNAVSHQPFGTGVHDNQVRGSGDSFVPSLHFNKQPGHQNGRSLTVIDDGRITFLERTEVSSDREGQIFFYGTEVPKGEEKNVPPKKLIVQPFLYLAVEVDFDRSSPAAAYPLKGTPDGEKPFLVPMLAKDPNSVAEVSLYFTVDDSNRVYTRWKEGMPLRANHVKILQEDRKFRKLEEQAWVEKDQILALINPEQAVIELQGKYTKLQQAEASRRASEKTRDEALTRVRVLDDLKAKTPGAVSAEEYRGAVLTHHKYLEEEIEKRAAVRTAEFDVFQAMKAVKLHEVRAPMSGVIKTINKNRGDGVKAYQDTLLQIVNPNSLRVEALAEEQDVRKLKKGDQVMLEVSLRVTPKLTLSGAHRDINSVAVSAGSRPLIIAASEDQTLRGWDARTGEIVLDPVRMPSAVRALACTPKGAEHDLLLVGSSDGSAHIFDLADGKGTPIALPERHKGPIAAVAFGPDGTVCATAGDDKAIIVWALNGNKWERQQVLVDAHRAPITSLAFTVLPSNSDRGKDDTSNWRLVSAGRDNVLMVWKAEKGKALVQEPSFDRRSGDVTLLGADGDRVLFDAGKELRVVSLSDHQINGTMRNASAAAGFLTMALFAPDGRTVLTNGPEGRPQLWRAPPKAGDDADPLTEGRGSELRQLASKWGTATCGAFDPAGRFAVTGTQDGKVLVWDMPSREEIELRIPATISLVEHSIEANQVRVWADLKESPAWLVPGSKATIVVVPPEPGK
jgi:WD40 repeat protein